MALRTNILLGSSKKANKNKNTDEKNITNPAQYSVNQFQEKLVNSQ